MSEGSEHIDYREAQDLTEVHAAIQRENKDPSADVTPVPLWVTVLCGAAVCWAGAYIGMFHGGFNSNVYNEYESSPAVLFPLPVNANAKAGPAIPDDPVAVGRGVYMGNCVSCHLASGAGQPGLIPPLAGSEWVTGSEKRASMILLKGLMGPVKVKGAAFNGVMPPWEGGLNDKKIAAVLTYVRQEWGNKAPEITPAQINAARKEFSAKKVSWNEAELLQVPEDAKLEGGAPAGGAPAPNAPAVPVAGAPASTPATSTPAPAADGFDLAASVLRGKAIYSVTCIACHQPTGNGLPPVFPPLNGSEFVNGDQRRFVAITIKGAIGELSVKGTKFNGVLLAVDMQFPQLKDDAKLADVLNYVSNSWDNKVGKPITPAFIQKVRDEFKDRATPWTEPELLNFPPTK